jgi:hypothetical protein
MCTLSCVRFALHVAGAFSMRPHCERGHCQPPAMCLEPSQQMCTAFQPCFPTAPQLLVGITWPRTREPAHARSRLERTPRGCRARAVAAALTPQGKPPPLLAKGAG